MFDVTSISPLSDPNFDCLSGDKPHLCEICKKSFSEKAALAQVRQYSVKQDTLYPMNLQHLRTHSNDKPHTCPHEGCDKSFALASALTIHLRMPISSLLIL